MEILCKLCNASTSYIGETTHDGGPHPVIHHYRCSTCKLVFVGNHVTGDDLEHAYGMIDMRAYYDEIVVELSKKMQYSIGHLRSLGLKENDAIIDVGTGNGLFLKSLYDAGFRNLAGHEIPGGDAFAIQNLPIRMYHDFDHSTVPDGAFDCVTLLDVAEHVIDPHAVFAACNRMLKPNGILYFHTPMVTPTDRLMQQTFKLPVLRKVGQTWQTGRTSIYHLQNYTTPSIAMLMRKYGFDDFELTRENELSWPLARYVEIYLCQRFGLPKWTSRLMAPAFWPLLSTRLFNPNKGIVVARKCRSVPAVDRQTHDSRPAMQRAA